MAGVGEPTDGAGTEAVVRAYYAALDGHAYENLESLLASDFRQRRPDRTLEGREAFVRFMREERPNRETTHELESVVVDGDRAVVRGRLLDGGEELLAFSDHFALEDGRINRLETDTR
ncbi:nuclear transport factor 2 family protein [Natrononativus amylolyticus]|uniref:nuclear transport factor 2 family protein n=1 Tax=Natrononativus amylolyticus TaxID=2963434 RepID=UPI0020CD3166|nr:nuclear transport factor 2 family protein [Natrononativus amylolyticus]